MRAARSVPSCAKAVFALKIHPQHSSEVHHPRELPGILKMAFPDITFIQEVLTQVLFSKPQECASSLSPCVLQGGKGGP